jgi:hypothetical protein
MPRYPRALSGPDASKSLPSEDRWEMTEESIEQELKDNSNWLGKFKGKEVNK